ncbi:MAG TPA: chemotaxis response regulator protein-glutamate methylesterase [Syntrophomonadaceae bacterium]|nr:chemotaxis response regulator protein-glutamate methylesterase [Syntrophomonadaceae bacterium]
MSNSIKVLVVDDSAFMRRVVSDIINMQPGMEVIGKARDGADALAKISELHPDVVTMDIEMPNMDGLTAIKKIMEVNPLPIIMLSSLTKSGAEQTMKALNLGAIDFITKPSTSLAVDIDMIKDDIVRKIMIAAGTKKKLQNSYVIGNITRYERRSVPKIINPAGKLNKLVLIGTSTGGPKALHQVIPKFPADLDAAVLVVQHMPPGFTRSLAERLDSLSALKVKEAEHGEPVLTGYAYIAPGDYHLTVAGSHNDLHINLTHSEPRGGHRPSVDEMFYSAAGEFWSRMVGVIMTGMGQDGSAGLAGLKEKGARIIAEDQSTCIVYGMPKAAVETGMVDSVVPLGDIADEVMRMLNK